MESLGNGLFLIGNNFDPRIKKPFEDFIKDYNKERRLHHRK